ncbi:MAG: hypothetical protein IID52_09390, partial [Proteobacteria bacterium]|nr:hypothetical protein [Pseudomonadota bacterium]
LTKKTYPVYEEIDGRLYVNIAGLKPKDIALLLLYFSYPERLERSALVQSVERHGTTKSAATSAVHRLKSLVDEKNGHWKLRNIGKTEAEALLKASGNTS